MTRRYRARGTFLGEMVFLIPIVAVAFTVTYQLTAQALRFQRQTLTDSAGDASRADLLRRISQDAECARSAVVERVADAVVLELQGCRPASLNGADRPSTAPAELVIRYRAAGSEVVRTEPTGEASAEAHQWSVGSGSVDFAVEAIGDEPALVWISFVKREQREQGPELERKLTAAERIGRGGQP